MAGAATVVILQQLKGVLGLEHFTHKTDVIDVLHSIFTQTHQVYLYYFLSPQLYTPSDPTKLQAFFEYIYVKYLY